MDNSALPPVSSGVSVHNKSCDGSIFCEAHARATQTKMATHVVGDKAQAQSTESKILPNNESKRAEKRKSEKVKDSSKMHDTLRAMLDQVLQNQNTFNKSLGDLGNKVKVLWKDCESYRNEFDQDHDPVDEVAGYEECESEPPPIKKLTEVALTTKLAFLTVVRGLILMAMLMQCPRKDWT